MMSDFQVTQIEKRHKKLKYDMKEYVLRLVEVCKILNNEDLDQMTCDNFLEDNFVDN